MTPRGDDSISAVFRRFGRAERLPQQDSEETVSNKTVPINLSSCAERTALDDFLPEAAIKPVPRSESREGLVDRRDITLDPVTAIDEFAQPETTPMSTIDQPTKVQFWPMLAAACVVLGISLLALALFARFQLPV